MWGDGFVGPGQSLMPELAKLMNLTSSSSVLNIGAETGGPAMVMAEKYRSYVTAVDVCPLLIERATERFKRARLSRNAKADILDIGKPGGDRKYEAVFVKDFLFRIENKLDVIERLQERVKPRGAFLITDYVLERADSLKGLQAWAAAEPQQPYPAVAAEAVEMLKQCNFDVRVVKDLTDEYRALIGSALAALRERLKTHAVSGETRDAVLAEIELWAYRADALRRGLQVQRVLSLTI
jgi:cyclopropane fatty-acyl-phospholipid synthase-like methyltransferase